MRPLPPDLAEHPKIKRAFRAAIFMKWGAVPLMGISQIIALFIGWAISWRLALLFLLLAWAMLFIVGYATARCPRCGQVWWSRTVMFLIAPWLILFGGDDETDSFVCRKCGLDIGLGLRK